jgi:hypothetical protein
MHIRTTTGGTMIYLVTSGLFQSFLKGGREFFDKEKP